MKDDTLLIANAVITEIDTEKQTITVKDDVDESTLGEGCLTECSSIPMVYCDFATQKVTKISFEDLQVNDKVIMCIRARKWRTSEAAATRRIRSKSNNCSCIRKDLPNGSRLSNAASRL